jgi:hypothetical protein
MIFKVDKYSIGIIGLQAVSIFNWYLFDFLIGIMFLNSLKAISMHNIY